MKCDQCEAAATLECGCRRCAREPEDERFWACAEHRQEVAQKHARIRERNAEWFAVTFPR